MWNFSVGRLEAAAFDQDESQRIIGPHSSTGTLLHLRVWGIQIKKISRLSLAAQIFKHLKCLE